jgi:hypothetical protein
VIEDANGRPRITFAGLRQDAITEDTKVTQVEVDPSTGDDCLGETKGVVLKDTGSPPCDWACTEGYTIWIARPATGNLLPCMLGAKGPA